MEKRRAPRYVAGVDGGGSKTACMIADSGGRLLAYAVTEGSNHQISGMERTVGNVSAAVDEACARAGISRGELDFLYMGIAGADLDEDFRRLNEGFREPFRDIPFTVVTDVWSALNCQAAEGWGAVSICGTGHNLGIRHWDGTYYPVRGLRYLLGNYGGGHHLAEMALHKAFRCEEATGTATRLAEELPAFCGCADMNELAIRIYESGYTYHRAYNIPRLVFELAADGDRVSKELIEGMGTELGEMLGRMIQKAGLDKLEVPVILSGSQYAKDEKGQMLEPMLGELRRYAPMAQVQVVRCPPVVGAVFASLREAGFPLPEEQMEQLRRSAQRKCI